MIDYSPFNTGFLSATNLSNYFLPFHVTAKYSFFLTCLRSLSTVFVQVFGGQLSFLPKICLCLSATRRNSLKRISLNLLCNKFPLFCLQFLTDPINTNLCQQFLRLNILLSRVQSCLIDLVRVAHGSHNVYFVPQSRNFVIPYSRGSSLPVPALGCTCLKLTLRVDEYNKKPQE